MEAVPLEGLTYYISIHVQREAMLYISPGSKGNHVPCTVAEIVKDRIGSPWSVDIVVAI